jgi:hypothetical protein
MTNRHKHLKAFKEAILRSKIIKKDLLRINNKIGNLNYAKHRNCAESAYVSTLEEIINQGKKYLSLNPESDESIRVAIDIDKYYTELTNMR